MRTQKEILHHAAMAFYQKEFQLTIDLCTEAITRDPSYQNKYMLADIYTKRGLAKVRLGLNTGHFIDMTTSAIEDFNKALELHENYALAYLYRGLLRYQFNQTELALGDFDRAIALKIDEPIVYFKRGLIKNNLEQYVEALDDLNMAVSECAKLNFNRERMAELYFARAFTFEKLKQHQNAFYDYQQAYALNSIDKHKAAMDQASKNFAASITSYDGKGFGSPLHKHNAKPQQLNVEEEALMKIEHNM